MAIAGHTFDSNDRCTSMTSTVVDGVNISHVCGKRWMDIMHCDHTYVGVHGYAHTAQLTASEISEITAERTKRERAYEDATKGVSGGGDYVEAPPVELPVQDDMMLCATDNTPRPRSNFELTPRFKCLSPEEMLLALRGKKCGLLPYGH